MDIAPKPNPVSTPAQLPEPKRLHRFRKFLGILIVLALIASGWFLYYRDHKALVTYKEKEQALINLRKAAESKTVAVFERLEGSSLYFRTPNEVTISQGKFVNYQEKIGTITSETKVYRAGKTGPNLQDIKAGTRIALDMTPDTKHPGQYIISAVYITE